MKSEAISKVYAKALFLSAQEAKETEAVQHALQELVVYMKEQKILSEAISSEAFSFSEKQALVAEFIKTANVHPKVGRLFELLVTKRRGTLLAQIAQNFQSFVDESQGVVRGEVRTVESLSDTEKEDLAKAFSKKLNKKVVLNSVTDRDILGGLVVSIQGKTFDGSLRTAIHNLKENLERQSI